jgi:formylglycine-generating enzyme required for sulfatase activity
MRTLQLFALLAALCAACADEPAQDDATPAGPAWLTARPENAHPYADETLARFGKLVESDDWRDVAWNAQGTLEAVHAKTGLVFVLVPRGEYMMGSANGEEREKPVHEVAVPAFLLCRTECTQGAWDRIGGVDHRGFEGARLPIEMVIWSNARKWCEKSGLRLPSESEWEYACRAGSTGRWCSGDDETLLAEHAWYYVNSASKPPLPNASWDWDKALAQWGCRTHIVGKKRANAWGLHDMHGNVAEWCEDTGGRSYAPVPRDGTPVTVKGYWRVFRGGSAADEPKRTTSSWRFMDLPGTPSKLLGFRPAVSLTSGSPSHDGLHEDRFEQVEGSPARAWQLASAPRNAREYASVTLARFRMLGKSGRWRDPTWNSQGMLQTTHVRTGLAFVVVPAGEYMMGSPEDAEYPRGNSRPIHKVSVQAFLFCTTECTQDAWDRIDCEDERSVVGDDLPICGVSWDDSTKWCNKMELRLPSEAEWEYACRAGTSSRFWSGDKWSHQKPIGHSFASGQIPGPVGTLCANPFGLYDVIGNVWEWCEDTWHDSYGLAPNDGRAWVDEGPSSRVARVLRGGSALMTEPYLGSAVRGYGRPDDRHPGVVGFRPAADLPR